MLFFNYNITMFIKDICTKCHNFKFKIAGKFLLIIVTGCAMKCVMSKGFFGDGYHRVGNTFVIFRTL